MSADTDTPAAQRFRDFDAEFLAHAPPPIEVGLFGRRWHLPGELPAAGVLMVARWVSEGRAHPGHPQAAVSNAELISLAEALIPGEIMDAWRGKGLGMRQLGGIVEWVLDAYRDQIQEAFGPSGEAEAPPGAPPSTPSSNGGGSSAPTSDASTPSTSPPPGI